MLPFYTSKTLLALKNEIESYTNIGKSLLMNTTLNYKYNVFPNNAPNTTPKIRYFGIGIGGTRFDAEKNALVPYIPKATDMDLYTPIPFRCVQVDNDLEEDERQRYRMRVRKTINGIDYYCYYLKVIDYTTPVSLITMTDLSSGNESVLELDSANLYPTPDPLVQIESLEEESEVNCYVETKLTITGSEVVEAINILYNGDLNKAMVNEIGLYMGEDQEVTLVEDSGPVAYIEAIYAQLAMHKCFMGYDFSNIDKTEEIIFRISSSSSFVL